MRVCVYLHTQIRMSTCICRCVNIYVCTNTYIYLCKYICIRTCFYMYNCSIHVRMHKHICVFICIYTYVTHARQSHSGEGGSETKRPGLRRDLRFKI